MRLAIALLVAVWVLALAVWALALVDFEDASLARVGRDVRAYCFGWDRPDAGAAIGGTLVMAGTPGILSLATLLVWRRELLGSRRGRKTLCLLAVLAMAAMGAILAGRSRAEAADGPPASGTVRRAAPDFALADERGERFSLSDARGKVVCLTFFYTRCHGTCPDQVAKLQAVQRRFRDRLGRDLLVVAVSLDPVRDDRSALQAYQARLGCVDEGWRFLGGTREEVRAILEAYQVAASVPAEISATTQIGHTALIVVVDRNGQRALELLGTTWEDSLLLEKVGELLAEE